MSRNLRNLPTPALAAVAAARCCWLSSLVSLPGSAVVFLFLFDAAPDFLWSPVEQADNPSDDEDEMKGGDVVDNEREKQRKRR